MQNVHICGLTPLTEFPWASHCETPLILCASHIHTITQLTALSHCLFFKQSDGKQPQSDEAARWQN